MIWVPQFRVINNALGEVFNEHELSQVFKIIVPIQCYEQLVNYTHTVTLKHLGANKTIAYLKSNCILPGIDKIAHLCISKCRECATQKAFMHNTRAPKLELYHNEPIGQFIFCDHAGPFPYKSGGYQYILAIQDMTSKHLMLYGQKTLSAEETMKKLLHYMQTHGYVTKMLMDNVRTFKNQLMEEFTTSLNIWHLFSSAFFPSANGQIEKVNVMVGDLLMILTQYSSPYWSKHLHSIAAVYNACKHSAMGISPNELFYGRRLLLPATAFTDLITAINSEDQMEDKLLSHLVHLHKGIEKARAVNLQQLHISKIYFDRFSSCINSYAVGQRVFLKQPNRQKLQLRYPKEFEVVRKIYDNVYEVCLVEDPADVRWYNVAWLKPFSAAFLLSSITSATQTSSTEENQGNSGATEPKTVISLYGPHNNEYMERNTVQSGNLAHEAQQRIRGEATTKYENTNRQYDVYQADGHSSYITRSVSRRQHEHPEDRSGADSASVESQWGRRIIAMEQGAPQKDALSTQQRNTVTMRHSSTQPAAVSFMQNGKDQGESAIVVVLSDPDGENCIAAESDHSLTAAQLNASDSNRRVRGVAHENYIDGLQNSTVRDELSHISVMCGDSTSEHVNKAPSSGYATAADRDDSGLVMQRESGEADVSPSRQHCAGVAQATREYCLGQNSEVDNFPPLFHGIPDPEWSTYVPAQQNPQTQEYDIRYKMRSYS